MALPGALFALGAVAPHAIADVSLPEWYVTIGGGAAVQGADADVVLAAERDSSMAVTHRVSTADVEPGAQPMLRIEAGARASPFMLEGSVFAVRTAEASTAFMPSSSVWANGLVGLNAAGNFTVPLDELSFRRARVVRGGALSVRRPLTLPASVRFGVDYTDVSDQLELQALGVDVPGATGRRDRLVVQTSNDRFGAHVGLDYVTCVGPADLVLRATVGAALVNVDQDTHEETDADPQGGLSGVLIDTHGDDQGWSASTELRGTLRLPVGPVAFFVSADLRSVGGLALAPEQLALLGDADRNPTRTVDAHAGVSASSTLVLWSAIVGIEARP